MRARSETPSTTPTDTGRPRLGDLRALAVDRAITELRSGRPVRIEAPGGDVLMLAAETAADLRHDWGASRLVLPAHHPAVAGTLQAGTLAVAQMDDAALSALVYPGDRCAAVHPFGESREAEAAAVALCKLAQLFPAALVGADVDDPMLVRAEAGAIRGYHVNRADTLTLVSRAPVPLTDETATEFVVFRGGDGLKDQVAIIVGNPDLSQTVPVRLHSACLTGDLFDSLKCDCGAQLRRAVRSLSAGPGGIICYLDQEGRGLGLGNKMRAYALQAGGDDTVDADARLGYGPDERRYAIAARMLRLLGVSRIALLTNNPDKVAAMGATGIEVTDRVAILGAVNTHNRKYLTTKAERAGHVLPQLRSSS